MFSAEEPIWVRTKPVVEQDWSPCYLRYEGHDGWVTVVAFSPDGSRIVSGSWDKTVRVWNTKSGEDVHSVDVDCAIFRIRFERSSDSVLRLSTDAGDIDLDLAGRSSIPTTVNGKRGSIFKQLFSSSRWTNRWCNLSDKGSCVIWRGRKAIWLPPDVRPGVSAVSRDGSAIALGCPTGRMVIMGIS
jgi:WD40 repeat protein